MKRIFAMLMALVLILGCVPTQIRAEEAPTVTAIQVTTLPAKTQYTGGETLDVTGGVVTVTYSDSTTQTVDEAGHWFGCSGCAAR